MVIILGHITGKLFISFTTFFLSLGNFINEETEWFRANYPKRTYNLPTELQMLKILPKGLTLTILGLHSTLSIDLKWFRRLKIDSLTNCEMMGKKIKKRKPQFSKTLSSSIKILSKQLYISFTCNIPLPLTRKQRSLRHTGCSSYRKQDD